MRLGNQASKDVVELFLSEKRGHSGDSENLAFVGVIPGSGHGCDDGILICVLAVGVAFDQLVAGPLFATDGCLKRMQNAILYLTKEVETLEEYKTKLIADVVTGKIDVRDVEIPEYEFVDEDADADSDSDDDSDDTEEQEG